MNSPENPAPGEDNEQPDEGMMVESDNTDLKPAGKISYDKERQKYIGGWKVDEEGFFFEPAGDREKFERMKNAYILRKGWEAEHQKDS